MYRPACTQVLHPAVAAPGGAPGRAPHGAPDANVNVNNLHLHVARLCFHPSTVACVYMILVCTCRSLHA